MKRTLITAAMLTTLPAIVLLAAQRMASSQQLQPSTPQQRTALPPQTPHRLAPPQQQQAPRQPPQQQSQLQPQQMTFNMSSRQISRGSGTATDPWRGWDKFLNAMQGAKRITAYWPTGYYQIQETVNIPSNGAWRLMGDGQQRSVIVTGAGFSRSVFVCGSPVQKIVTADLEITGLTLERPNVTSRFDKNSAAIVIESVAYVKIRDFLLVNWACGIILDEATDVAISDGRIVNQDYAGRSPAKRGVWIVNGDARRKGAVAGCTNVISIEHVKFDGPQTHIVDDGGYAHFFRSNNFNVCYPALYAAGVIKLVFADNYCEATGQEGPTIKIDHRLFDDEKVSVAGCSVPSFVDNYFVTGPFPAIVFRTGSASTISGNFFGGVPDDGAQVLGVSALGPGAITAHTNFYYGKSLFDDGKPATRLGQAPLERAAK